MINIPGLGKKSLTGVVLKSHENVYWDDCVGVHSGICTNFHEDREIKWSYGYKNGRDLFVCPKFKFLMRRKII